MGAIGFGAVIMLQNAGIADTTYLLAMADALEANGQAIKQANALDMEAGAAMGLGAGGELRQKVYPDPYGVRTWDPDNTFRRNFNVSPD